MIDETDPTSDHHLPTGEPEAPRGSAVRTVVEWVVLVACAVLVAVVVKTFLFQAFYIPSESMVPTLEEIGRAHV